MLVGSHYPKSRRPLTWNRVLANISTEANSPVLLPPREPTPKIKQSPERLKTTRTPASEPNVGPPATSRPHHG